MICRDMQVSYHIYTKYNWMYRSNKLFNIFDVSSTSVTITLAISLIYHISMSYFRCYYHQTAQYVSLSLTLSALHTPGCINMCNICCSSVHLFLFYMPFAFHCLQFQLFHSSVPTSLSGPPLACNSTILPP